MVWCVWELCWGLGACGRLQMLEAACRLLLRPCRLAHKPCTPCWHPPHPLPFTHSDLSNNQLTGTIVPDSWAVGPAFLTLVSINVSGRRAQRGGPNGAWTP